MAHNEAPIARFNAKKIVLYPEDKAAPSVSGTIVVSGAKLYFYTGAGWEIVTSA